MVSGLLLTSVSTALAQGAAAATHAPGVLVKLAGLAGVLLTLTVIGFGVVAFAHPQLETISDTVAHNLARSFLAGLLAEIVVLPSLAFVVAGLVLSVIGIFLIPFVLVAAGLLLAASILLGFLAMAHAMGETRVRRRLAAGARVSGMNSYRYLLTGLSGLAALWLGWALVGWVPVAGVLVLLAALLATWTVGTVGFGAALLSRGGTRQGFSGRYLPAEAMTDEYLWATPLHGVTAVKGSPRKRE